MNGIERDLDGQARVVRLNLLSSLGREVARSYGVRAIPTILVFDGGKNVAYRHSGMPNRKEIVARVRALR